jgi:hypothetical protein
MQDVSKYKDRIEELAVAIRGLGPDLDRLAQPFRRNPDNQEPKFDEWSGDFWRRNAFGNALIRLYQLSNNNFQFIEMMGLLALARYVFELSIWLRLFQQDVRYGLVYYRELLEAKLRYFKDTTEHLRREVELLKRFEEADGKAQRALIDAYKQGTVRDISASMAKATETVDTEASRNFSIYLDDAKVNGYGLQAHLVENKAIPQVDQAIKDLTNKIAEFSKNVPSDVQDLANGRWQWRRMAQEVGLAHEHDYIYSFASKLLHATPASLTTDKKNLELSQMYIFLRYIHVKILEIMDLARLQPEVRPSAGASSG